MKRRKAAGRKEGRSRNGARRRKPVAEIFPRISARTAILAILLVIFVAFAVGPVTRNLEATSRLKEKEAELKEQESVTKSLEGEVREARSLEYVEKEARRQRMVAPREVLYLVTPDQSEAEVEYRVKNLQSMDEAWERVRKMLHSTHCSGQAGD